jgi:hypothetical protein
VAVALHEHIAMKRLLSSLLALGLSGAWMLAHASDKPRSGKLLAAEVGDVACYLSLESGGQEFSEMATFEVCEQAERCRGKQLQLQYRRENVLSAECQGDMDCGKSDSVELISAISGCDTSQVACAASEQTIFACSTGKKGVAVCAGGSGGYLEYRFGAATAELVLPKARTAPAQAAVGANFPLAGGGGAYLSFASGDYRYSVYTAIGRFGEGGETQSKAGISVLKAGRAIAHLPCLGEPESELGPDWFEQYGIETGDFEFELP